MEELLLYQLIQENRSYIELVRKEEVTPDFKTGRRTIVRTVYTLDAVYEVTNNWMTRTLNRTDIDMNTKGWLIVPRDLPDLYYPSLNDVVQDYGKSVRCPKLKAVYQVKSVEEVNGGILVIAQRLSGAEQNAILSPAAFDNANMTEGTA